MWAENHPEKIWEWWCIGDGPLRDKLSVLPIPQNAVIKLHGNIQYSELAKYYQLAGAFIFPTLADEWGVVINEAMGSGLPILGSVYSQAVEELIEEGVTGWLFRPDHPDEIYTALNKFYTIDEQELNNMRIAVRRKISNITSEVNAQKLVMSLENHTHQK
jgi:glycosyltransferase involved in cell wall biosynthesis